MLMNFCEQFLAFDIWNEGSCRYFIILYNKDLCIIKFIFNKEKGKIYLNMYDKGEIIISFRLPLFCSLHVLSGG